jgi:hypothetical protein
MEEKYKKERETFTEIFTEVLKLDEDNKEASEIKMKLMEDRKILSMPEMLTDSQLFNMYKQ